MKEDLTQMDRALLATSEWQALGQLIRERRLALGLTLVELAGEVELSQPFLSQIENGRARLSMSSLYRISRALETTPQALFGGPPIGAIEPELVRATDRESIAVSGDAAHALCRVLLPGGAPFHVIEFCGLPDAFEDFWEHDGFEAVYVIEGPVDIELGTTVTTLTRGDFISYDALMPHRLRAPHGGAKLLMVETPRNPAHGVHADHHG